MNPTLKDYLLNINVRIVNPIHKSIRDKEVIGWHCASTSNLRYHTHLEMIRQIIEINGLGYEVVDLKENNLSFFIYK